jgi:DNA-binding response OmpR family regulator
MPGGGTMTAIEEYRRRNRRGRVLVVSGHVREDLIVRGIETGTVSFLPKPYNRIQLLEAIAMVLRRARARGPAG